MNPKDIENPIAEEDFRYQLKTENRMDAKEFIDSKKFIKSEPFNVSEQDWLNAMEEYAEQKCKELESLISHQDKYINLLEGELDEVVPIAHTHGWRSNRAKQGEDIRARIKRIRNA